MALLAGLAGGRASLKTVGHAAAYAALRALWFVLGVLPPLWARRILEAAGAVVGRVDRRHREIVRSNLLIAFPGWTHDMRSRVVDRTFRNWGRVAAEVLHAERIARAADTSWVERAEAMLAELSRKGTGVLVLTAHLGNFELLGRVWGLASGRRIVVLHRPMDNRFVDAFVRRDRAAMNVDTLGRGTVARAALALVRSGGVVAAPLDQNQPPGRPGVFVELFGRPAATSTALARLSLATGAPVLPVFATWTDRGPDAFIGEPIEPGSRGQNGAERAGAVLRLTAEYTRVIEAAVRRHPEQWNWAHRRWKTRPEDCRGLGG